MANGDSIEGFIERNYKKLIAGTLGAVVGLTALLQGCYTIPTDSQGVVRRFGAYNRTTEPGIHLKVPFFIEKLDKVPVRKIQKQEFGFRTEKAGIETIYRGADSEGLSKEEYEMYQKEYLMLTGDLNMADIEWIVQYKIKDPVDYLFNVRDPVNLVRDASQSVMRQIIGDGSVDESITIGRMENENKAKEGLQKLLDKYSSGIHVVTVKLQSCNPPKRVKPSFNAVNEAMQEKQRRINNAMEAYNKVIPKARGEAEKMIKEAEAYKIRMTNEAQGDADRFLKVLEEYEKAPEITRRRLYLETMEKVLQNIGTKNIVEQKGAEGGLLLKLDVGESAGGNAK